MSGVECTDEFKREVAERLRISTKSSYAWQMLFSRPMKVIHEVDAQADAIRPLKRDLARVADLSRTRKQSGELFSGEWGHSKKATADFARESSLSRMQTSSARCLAGH